MLIRNFLIAADIAKDGIYGGIFYPSTDGDYVINILAEEKGSNLRSNFYDRLLQTDQSMRIVRY